MGSRDLAACCLTGMLSWKQNELSMCSELSMRFCVIK